VTWNPKKASAAMAGKAAYMRGIASDVTPVDESCGSRYDSKGFPLLVKAAAGGESDDQQDGFSRVVSGGLRKSLIGSACQSARCNQAGQKFVCELFHVSKLLLAISRDIGLTDLADARVTVQPTRTTQAEVVNPGR